MCCGVGHVVFHGLYNKQGTLRVFYISFVSLINRHPFIHNSESFDAAKTMNQPGHVPMLVWHDENDSFECSGSLPGISVVNSLSKAFPATGRYKGGMILRLYKGIGEGICFTKDQARSPSSPIESLESCLHQPSHSSVVCPCLLVALTPSPIESLECCPCLLPSHPHQPSHSNVVVNVHYY